MSQTFSIACRECKVSLWIAQARYDGSQRTLYADMPEVMVALREFLFDHRGHALVFDENVESEIGDWTDIEPEKPA